jgi:dsDNA-binding SOS-regulon protein
VAGDRLTGSGQAAIMSERTRRAVRAFEGHLAEVMEMEDAGEIADRLERTVTEEYLDRALERQREHVDVVLGQHREQVDLALRQQRDHVDIALEQHRRHVDLALGEQREHVDVVLGQQREHLDLVLAGLTDHMAAMWRRDLLLVSGAQFFALAAAVAALVGLG